MLWRVRNSRGRPKNAPAARLWNVKVKSGFDQSR